MTLDGTALEVHQHDSRVGPHVAGGTHLVLEVKLAPPTVVEDRQTVATPIALRLPTQILVAIDDWMAVPRPWCERWSRNHGGSARMQRGDHWIVHRPQGGLGGLEQSVGTIQRSARCDLAALQVDGQHHCPRESERDDLFQEHREDLFRTLCGQ